MCESTCDIGSVRAIVFAERGPLLAAERDASDFVSAALEREAAIAVIPVARLAEDFFRLETGLAGAAIQKFVNYRLCVALLGDVSAPVAQIRRSAIS
ncbi:DUF4180 domain-containing protein [Methylosinus sp. Sm6]|uniref:DUF4180 domain-containing protein n=1 Tax=Methylosinus sp. Sm6 TaxID=2866948 RepID=UPI00351CCC6B